MHCNIGEFFPIFRSDTEQISDEESKMTFKESFANWRRYRNTCSELYRMTDRELSDIGIARGDIPFVARQSTR